MAERTVSMRARFIANDDGTHDWTTIPTERYEGVGTAHQRTIHESMQFVRVKSGRGEREVCQLLVNHDVDGEKFLSLQQEEILKTKQQYKTGRYGGPLITNREDYAEFLAQFIEAGRRAGFIG